MKRTLLIASALTGLAVGCVGSSADDGGDESVCEQAYMCMLDTGCRPPVTTAEFRALSECEDQQTTPDECAAEQATYDAVFTAYNEDCREPCLALGEFDEVSDATKEAADCLSWEMTPDDEKAWYSAETLAGWEAGCSWTCGG